MSNTTVPENIIKQINSNSKFIIVAHKQPDADTLTSAVALGSFLERSGKIVSLYTAGPFSRVETLHLEDRFKTTSLTQEDKKDAVVIIVDCNSPDRVGFLENDIADMPIIIIDHHATESNFGLYSWIDSNYPSTSLMIQDLILSFTKSISPLEAEMLFLGFCTDTGFFRHLDHGSELYIEKAANMVRFGASPKEAYAVVTGGKSLASRKLLGRILERTEDHYNGKLLVSWENIADREELKADDRDSDTLYGAMLSISGVQAIAVVREESLGRCSVGLRSIQDVDVRKVAETFGGGGHQRASGFVTDGNLTDIKSKLIVLFKEYL